MILTICAVLWFASRIYRVGILMYGKKPNLPEILRWLKYSYELPLLSCHSDRSEAERGICIFLAAPQTKTSSGMHRPK